MYPASLRAALTRTLAATIVATVTGCTVRVGGVAIPIPDPTVDVPIPVPSGGSSAGSTRVLARADDYLGVPYKWGGTSPRTGFDCSGYVQYVYRREGVQLPRTSRQQAVAGTRRPTRWDAAGPGDLVMFANPGEPISHVAFYAGNGRIIHSSSSGGGVRYDDLASRRGQWYRQRLVAVRRVSGRGPAIAKGLLERLGLSEVRLDPPDRAPRP
ncbi:MAG TPA: C40 family peptidase [Gemmatimonadaceae bacterium]